MTYFSRLTDIVTCNLTKLLAEADDPAAALQEIIAEMDAGMAGARRSMQTAQGNEDRIRGEVEKRWAIEPNLRDVRAREGVEFVYALNLSRCVGCRMCVHACVEENNQSRSPEMQYIRVLEMPRGTLDPEHGDHHYDHATVPDDDHFYMPVQCHQCANPPCVKVCPVEATWQEPDGITVVDYDWCIGCRYGEAACPYFARRFNFTEPGLTSTDVNPDMESRPSPIILHILELSSIDQFNRADYFSLTRDDAASLGGDPLRLHEASRTANLAVVERALGHYDEAIVLHEQALEARQHSGRRCLAEDHHVWRSIQHGDGLVQIVNVFLRFGLEGLTAD